MSVSKATRSPGSITLLLASWNHGLVRGPDVSRQHSIHSPSWAMLVWWRMLHSSFSVMPGLQRLTDAVDADVAHIDRQLQRHDLFGRLDHARQLQRLLRVEQLDAGVGEVLARPTARNGRRPAVDRARRACASDR